MITLDPEDVRWIAWRNESRGKEGKLTKVPYGRGGRRAKADDEATWLVRAEAETLARHIVNGAGGGLGYELGDIGNDLFVAGLDLDSCVGSDGSLAPWATAILDLVDTYAETSPSGNGIKAFFYLAAEEFRWFLCRIGVPASGWGCRRGIPGEDARDHGPAIEVYCKARYFAVTENRWPGAPDRLRVLDRDDLERLARLIPPAKTARTGKTGSGDNSRSAAAYRKGAAMRRAGKTFEEMVEALRSDPETAEWCCEKADADGGREFRRIWDKVDAAEEAATISVDDFYALMPSHDYIFTPTGTTWPASSVNSRIPPIPLLDASGNPITNKKGDEVFLTAAQWLDRNKPVEQLTWAPGSPAIIRNKLMRDGGGGWQEHPGKSCFNLYHPPVIEPGDAAQAERWVGHIEHIYPAEAAHIIRWLAHRVQFPGEKINHALLLGGTPGIGKDTLLVPVVYAIGSWNFREATPIQILDRFTDYLKAVILRVSETRDLGDSNRIAFYDHLKTYTAAPPDTLVVNEKHMRPYSIPNALGVVLTTNYKVDGMYLPPDDRRVFAAWSDSRKEDFEESYWVDLYRWYDEAGVRHVAAYLRQLDISGFNPKAPPPRTEAWHAIVMHNAPYEERELNDVLDSLGRPHAVSLGTIQQEARSGISGSQSLGDWITDRKNRRAVPARLERCGYTPLRNPYATDGLWVIAGRRQTVYGKDDASITDRMEAAGKL